MGLSYKGILFLFIPTAIWTERVLSMAYYTNLNKMLNKCPQSRVQRESCKGSRQDGQVCRNKRYFQQPTTT